MQKKIRAIFVPLVLCSSLTFAASLREQIGQMIILGFNGLDVNPQSDIIKDIDVDNIGGVVLFDYDQNIKKYEHNIRDQQQLQQLTKHLQDFTYKFNQAHHRPQLPLFIAVDYEGGKVNRLHERYGFKKIPAAAEVSKMSWLDANKVVTNMAETLKNTGFNVDYAPVLDLNTNQSNPIIGKLGRSFSNDPLLVAKYANLYSTAFNQHGVQCAYKHFPGHGSSTTDSHQGFVDVSTTWNAKELIPYQQLLNKKNSCNIVMTAHVVNRQLDNSGLPATLSYKILTGLLRNKLKFNGIIITDDLQMKAIEEHYSLKQALTLAINAGADQFIIGNQLTKIPIKANVLVDLIEEQVKAGKISRQRIADAYQHIILVKKSLISPRAPND